jgi:hypothetical protein
MLLARHGCCAFSFLEQYIVLDCYLTNPTGNLDLPETGAMAWAVVWAVLKAVSSDHDAVFQ